MRHQKHAACPPCPPSNKPLMSRRPRPSRESSPGAFPHSPPLHACSQFGPGAFTRATRVFAAAVQCGGGLASGPSCPPALPATPSISRCCDSWDVCLGLRCRRGAGSRGDAGDLTGTVRRRQGPESRRVGEWRRQSGTDAACAPRVAFLRLSGSAARAAASARSFGPCAPRIRLCTRRDMSARTALLAVVSCGVSSG